MKTAKNGRKNRLTEGKPVILYANRSYRLRTGDLGIRKVNGQQDPSEIMVLLKKCRDTVTQGIRAMRAAKGIKADKLRTVIPKGGKMSPQFYTTLPAEEKDGDWRFSGGLVKISAVKIHSGLKAPMGKAELRAKEAGAEIPMDQGKLMLIEGNKLWNIHIFMEKMEGIVGGDPAAACGCRGAKAVSPLIFGDLPLIVDKISHCER